jgi:TolA-binding protein
MNGRGSKASGQGHFFERAVWGLRASGSKNEDAEALRARIMVSLHRRDRRRTTAIVFLIPLAAILVGSTAWGAGSNRVLSAWHALMAWIPHREAVPVPAPGTPHAAMAPRVPAVERASADPSEEPAPPEEPRPPTPLRVSAKPRNEAPDAQMLYRAAHKAHFADLDPTRALDRWNAYLAAFPGGAFALEARYNRALCLVRLGRGAEARQALEPFSRGDYGDYRRSEAAALLEALPEP